MTMTRRHFIELANIIHETGNPQLLDRVIDWLKEENPRFDAERFADAAEPPTLPAVEDCIRWAKRNGYSFADLAAEQYGDAYQRDMDEGFPWTDK